MTNAERLEFHHKVEASVDAGIALALDEHRRMGRSIVVWRDGKVVTIPPEEIPVLVAPLAGTNDGV
jgi:hypothetical protein